MEQISFREHMFSILTEMQFSGEIYNYFSYYFNTLNDKQNPRSIERGFLFYKLYLNDRDLRGRVRHGHGVRVLQP